MNFLLSTVNIVKMKNIEQFRLSEKYSVYKAIYEGVYTKENFLQRSSENEKVYHSKSFKTENSLDIQIQCPEFKSVDSQVIQILTEHMGVNSSRVAQSSWIYIQVPEFNMEWMHTHEYLESSNRTNLRTQWTYVFYIQIPENMIPGDGDLLFKTEDQILHRFVPREKEILIFPGDLPHIAMPSQSGRIDRVVYAGNLNFDFSFKNELKERIRFEEYI